MVCGVGSGPFHAVVAVLDAVCGVAEVEESAIGAHAPSIVDSHLTPRSEGCASGTGAGEWMRVSSLHVSSRLR